MIRVIFVNFCERVTFVILEICKDFVSKYIIALYRHYLLQNTLLLDFLVIMNIVPFGL